MNPIVLLAIGGVALMAMRKKKKEEEPAVGGDCASMGPFYHEGKISGWLVDDGQGGCMIQCETGYVLSPDGNACIPAEEVNHVVDEGQIDSAGGVWYDYRIWRMYDVAAPFVGEILLDAVWTSGPMGQSEAEVRDALQTMVDSLDIPEAGLATAPSDPCLGEFAGPFTAVGYDENLGAWVPWPNEPAFDNTLQPERRWCVVSYLENGLSMNEGRVLDVNGKVIYATGSEPDPNVAASKALWVSLYGPAEPRPWPETGGGLQFDPGP